MIKIQPEKYLNLIRCLRENSRSSITHISKRLNEPISTIFDRLKSTEKKFIKKYTSIIDFEKLGFSYRVNILIATEKDIGDFISQHKNF